MTHTASDVMSSCDNENENAVVLQTVRYNKNVVGLMKINLIDLIVCFFLSVISILGILRAHLKSSAFSFFFKLTNNIWRVMNIALDSSNPEAFFNLVSLLFEQ